MQPINKIFSVFLFFAFLFPTPASSQNELEDFQTIWENAGYQEIVEKLPKFRDKTLGGRNALVDYYLATSYCRIDGQAEQAQKFFDWMLSRYLLPIEFLDVVMTERAKCIATDPPVVTALEDLKNLHGNVNTVADIPTKTFTPGRRSGGKKYVRKPVTVSRPISEAEYQARLFKPENRVESEKKLSNILKTSLRGTSLKFKVRSTSHFLIVGINKSRQYMARAGKMLEKTLPFYQRAFGMEEPPYLLTIYLPTTGSEAGILAERMHGLIIDEYANLGYTSHEDQSIVAQSPEWAFGTLNHELFHLLSHQKFGDIPPWIDEGMAALYEVSEFDGNDYIGVHNWRGDKLKAYWNFRPSISELADLDWAALQRGSFLGEQEAAIFATARYFFLYLQDEKKKLGEMYQALQQLTPETMQVDPETDTKRIIETVLQMNLAEIDADFERWVKPVIGMR